MNLEGLTHKRKTISDLIRYIGNTADETGDSGRMKTPNFSILLGSGASVTSGIRSGQTLINAWKKEVFEESVNNKGLSFEEFYATGNAPDWYEESNAYSTLFENRYDLQRHRRMFVEREVAGKTPSIGYAYLVKLIEQGFFNTVFTTNFDDLLNEAFYRFSKNRPIVCAHDSSISGVTVTSSRPKIIKLHGDYLFENIKTTLRETESLETNMKMKFQEFAKDFGIIVVGYAGNDRSIMDILTYLLQHEDYFKNGIYWCIRKNDKEISSELKKLLWRDRVYFVEIDGFDEFFAEINHKLNHGVLPIDDNFLSRAHQESIIKDLTENQYINESQSDYLIKDCAKLKKHYEDNFATDFLQFIRDKKKIHSKSNEARVAQRKKNNREMTTEERNEFNNLITEAFAIGNTTKVADKLEKMDIFSLPDSDYKLQLLELQADLIDDMPDESVKRFFNELIRLDENKERYYEIAANRSRDYKQSFYYLKKATEKFCNDYYIINLYTSRLLEYCVEEVINEDYSKILESIISNINTSQEINPSINNHCHQHLLKYNKLVYANNNVRYRKEIEGLCQKVWALSHYHPQTLYILRQASSELLSEETFDKALEFYKKADNPKILEKVYIELIEWCRCQNMGFDKIMKIFIEYENDYICSDSFKSLKAEFLMSFEYFEDALNLLNQIPTLPKCIKNKMTILSILRKMDELESFYQSLPYKVDFELHYCELKDEYDKVASIYETMEKKNGHLSKSEASSYSYALLKTKKYDKVISVLKPYYDKPQYLDGTIIVNYLLAKKKLNHDVSVKIKEKLLDNKYMNFSEEEKFGATCILEDKNNAYILLCQILKKEPAAKYYIQKWPVLMNLVNDKKITDILKPNPHKL